MNLRLAAARALTEVIKDGRSLTSVLEKTLSQFDGKERAFIQAVCFGVLRYFHRLDFYLLKLLSKPLKAKDTDIKMLLLVGLYQLRFMRVKSHAAVSETVAAARKKAWAKSLINAVLRQFLREQENLEVLADQQAEAHFSHPQWLINQVQTDWPDESARILTANNQQPPMTIRVNVSKNHSQIYLSMLTEQGIPGSMVSFTESAIQLDQPVSVDKLPGFSEGNVSVQDAAAQLAAPLLDVRPGDKVLDLCAAPGGKTAAILELIEDKISMLAVDIDEIRLGKIKENLDRLNLSAEILQGDAVRPKDWAGNRRFDRILVDAPCSALGVIRRHPDIKLLRRASDIETLVSIQQLILQAAWDLLLPGGILLYATCSILKDENERQIEHFLKLHPDAQEFLIDADWGIKRPFGRQILTGDLGMDGFYYAKLVKNS